MSPKCSIAGARLTGRMKMIACRFHSGNTKLGTENHGAAVIGEKSSTFGTPNHMRTSAAAYPTTAPSRIGTIRISPLPSSVTTTVVISAIAARAIAVPCGTSAMAPSPDLPRARFTPTGARISPMTMMTGPVTTRGRYVSRNSLPLMRIAKLRTTYTMPEAAKPHSVPGMPQVWTP